MLDACQLMFAPLSSSKHGHVVRVERLPGAMLVFLLGFLRSSPRRCLIRNCLTPPLSSLMSSSAPLQHLFYSIDAFFRIRFAPPILALASSGRYKASVPASALPLPEPPPHILERAAAPDILDHSSTESISAPLIGDELRTGGTGAPRQSPSPAPRSVRAGRARTKRRGVAVLGPWSLPASRPFPNPTRRNMRARGRTRGGGVAGMAALAAAIGTATGAPNAVLPRAFGLEAAVAPPI